MSTSLYERISSLLAAVAWLLALVVGWLAILWWLRGEESAKVQSPLPPVTNAVQKADAEEGGFMPVPAVETVAMRSASMQDWVELAMGGAVQVAAETDDETQPSAESGAGTRDGRKAGPDGDSEPGGDGEEGLSRAQRWEIVIAASDRRDYAEKLDQLRIELGAVGKRPGVDYVRRLASDPLVRHGTSEDEKRLYFSWTASSPLVQWEQQLLANSGIEHEGRLVLRFVSPELENELAQLEIEYAAQQGHATVKDIARTVFVTDASRGVTRFVVGSQRYRRVK